MKILFENISDILNDKVTVYQRGLLITLILLKEDDSKLTLAKFKAKVNMKEAKLHLITLHEMGFIKWSGYNTAKKSIESAKVQPDVVEAITFMNELYKRRFDANSKATTSTLIARLSEYSLEDIKGVIANRYEVWKDDNVMNMHLNPTTIFRAKNFAKYYEDYLTTKRGSAIVNVDSIRLEDGQEITLEIANSFIDSETVKLLQYAMVNGKKTKAKKITVYVEKLKKMIKSEIDNEKHGGFKDFVYIYKK